MRQRSGPSREGAAEAIEGGATSGRALPHQGQTGNQGNGKRKAAMGIDRKHVLIACAIAGAVLGLVLAVLQAAGAFPHV